MRIYKNTVWITLFLTSISAICACYLQFICVQQEFWVNVSLSIFGSSLLTMLSSLVGYFIYKRKILENFYTHSLKIINQFNKIIYIDDMEKNHKLLEYDRKLHRVKNEEDISEFYKKNSSKKKGKKKKGCKSNNVKIKISDSENEFHISEIETLKKDLIKVMQSYISVEIDFMDLNRDYGDLDFFLVNKSFRKWIYEDIYSIIKDLRDLIYNRKVDFKYYISGEVTNILVMYDFVLELQNKIFRVETQERDKYISIVVYDETINNLDIKIEKLRSRIYNAKMENIDRKPIKSKIIINE